MKKIFINIIWASMVMYATVTHAGEPVAEPDSEPVGGFLGSYHGGMVGINNSRAAGAINAPGESTIAYIVQGGYFRGGYNSQLGMWIVGLGGYVDLHGYEKHSNGLAYGGHSLGLDAKLAWPVELWLPYAKLGYGYSAGTGDLATVSQYGFNKAIGLEYKLDINFGVVVEYKINNFRRNATEIVNKTVMFGFNYYWDPLKVAPVEKEVVEDLTLEPEPERAPDIPPDIAPPP